MYKDISPKVQMRNNFYDNTKIRRGLVRIGIDYHIMCRSKGIENRILELSKPVEARLSSPQSIFSHLILFYSVRVRTRNRRKRRRNIFSKDGY